MTAFDLIKLLIPQFHLDIKEMRAVYEVDGIMLDRLFDNVEAVKENQFILSADEAIIKRMEKFFGFSVEETQSLSERKQYLISYLTGFGKMSKDNVCEIIRKFTDAESDMALEQLVSGWQTLVITLERGQKTVVSWDKLLKTLADRLPAHLVFKCLLNYSNGSFTADNYTYEEMSQFTHEELANFVIPIEEAR